MYHKYILLILNCEKYKWKASLQKETWLKSLPSDMKYFHIIGDNSKCGDKNYYIDETDNVIYTNTKDDYLSLPHKVITALEAVNDTFKYDYIFKTDDDQFLINNNFFNVLENKLTENIYNYGGYHLSIDSHISEYWQVHDVLPRNLLLEKTIYCTGRFYLLSPIAVSHLLSNKAAISSKIIEDHAMGYYLSDDIKRFTLAINDIVQNSFIDYDKFVENNYYIYTECVNCPEICVNAILSYIKYHPYKVHVYLTENDKEYFDRHINNPQIIFHLLDNNMRDIYTQDGHLGTAIIWEKAIRSYYNYKIIHFDSDVVFREDAVNDIIKGLYTHDLVGPIRCYKHNRNGRDDIRHQSDVVSTYCFGFNSKMIDINKYDSDVLVRMVRGNHSPHGLHILDFFDPVSYEILNNGGTSLFIDFNTFGGLNQEGGRDNRYPLVNKWTDCGDKIIHFSSVGSGLNFHKGIKNNISTSVPSTYVEYSLKTLAMYNFLLFNKVTPRLDSALYEVKYLFDDMTNIKFIEFDY